MDTLEELTIDTTLEEELEFLKFVRQNGDVRILSAHLVNLQGPIEISYDEIRQLRGNGYDSECSFLLWNKSIPNPLCWSLYYSNYDRNWNAVERKHPDGLNPPKTLDEYLALYADFMGHPISDVLFMSGKIHSVLSPIIKVNIPSRTTRFMSLTVDFIEQINDVWIVWNAAENRWGHETRDLATFFENDFEQPAEFIEWQESVFNWLRNKWQDWIIPRFTYRLGPDTDSARRSAQALTNLLGENVAGFNPEPPVESPRRKPRAKNLFRR
jgi:hypothetical protein